MSGPAGFGHGPGWRRAKVAALCALPVVALGGIEIGARAGIDSALNAATAAQAAGDFASAVSLDNAVAAARGPLYLASGGRIGGAATASQSAELAWASALAAQGQPDQALTLLAGVTDPTLATKAQAARAAILLTAARAASQAGRHTEALARLVAIGSGGVPAASRAQANALQPGYEIAAAQQLTGSQAADAVVLLDDVVAHSSGASVAAANAQLPTTLLIAAEQSLAARATAEADQFLLRITTSFQSSPAAQQAQQLLRSPQLVSGTLTHHDGSPIAGSVRLSSRFRQVGRGYITFGPFYYGTANPSGDFSIAQVPVGGPYYLEVYNGGNWTTLIDPNTGGPADPVNVSSVQPVDLGIIVLPD